MDRTRCCSFSRLFLPNPLVSFNNDSLSTVFQYIMSPPSLRMKNSLSLYMALKIIVTALIMQRSLATVPFFNALYLVLSAFSMFFFLIIDRFDYSANKVYPLLSLSYLFHLLVVTHLPYFVFLKNKTKELDRIIFTQNKQIIIRIDRRLGIWNQVSTQ